jgi:hypothetical protein
MPTAPKLTIFAAMIAPLGLIWLTISAARQAANLAHEAKLLRMLSPISRTRGMDPNEVLESARRAAQSLGTVEARLHEAEARARRACAQLETERQTLSQLVDDFKADASRIEDAFDASSAGDKSLVRALAKEIADHIPRQEQIGSHSPKNTDPIAADRDDDFSASIVAPAGAGGEGQPRHENRSGRVERDSAHDRREVGERDSAYDRRESGERGSAHDRHDADEPYDRRRDRVQAPSASPHARREPPPPTAPVTTIQASLDWEKLVRAANFPDSEDDQATLDALYAVLGDGDAASLLQAAEDTLSSLADIGLYMEDLKPDHAPVDVWRKFIVHHDRRIGEELSGVQNHDAIADVSGALGNDPKFSKISGQFLERYEILVERMFHEAPDPALAVELADTRSGRAYLLIGQAAGRFN